MCFNEIAMKKTMMGLLSLGLLTMAACQEKIDVAKEKEAIKAVFEAEKAGFFSRDASAMAETWVQEPSSAKIYMSAQGQTRYDGWDAVRKHDLGLTKDDSWDRNLVKAEYSDYQIDIMDDSAWVLCKAAFSGTGDSANMNVQQSRIVVMKKVGGKWKFALMAIYNIPAKP
jgi:hypothetical protein